MNRAESIAIAAEGERRIRGRREADRMLHAKVVSDLIDVQILRRDCAKLRNEVERLRLIAGGMISARVDATAVDECEMTGKTHAGQ